ncbi:MAG TPA: hypothetical protein VHC22_20635 [Pirellulales bacterium]|nr:hypothetical protein [Pirellulales bacterium]
MRRHFCPRTAATCVLLVYTICLMGAGFNHANDIVQGDWFPYRHAPLSMNVYWTSLVALDPLAAVLLWLKPRVGLAVTLAIMVSDVAVNSYGVHGLDYHGWYACGSLQLQAMFLRFVVGSLPFVWPNGNRSNAESAAIAKPESE